MIDLINYIKKILEGIDFTLNLHSYLGFTLQGLFDTSGMQAALNESNGFEPNDKSQRARQQTIQNLRNIAAQKDGNGLILSDEAAQELVNHTGNYGAVAEYFNNLATQLNLRQNGQPLHFDVISMRKAMDQLDRQKRAEQIAKLENDRQYVMFNVFDQVPLADENGNPTRFNNAFYNNTNGGLLRGMMYTAITANEYTQDVADQSHRFNNDVINAFNMNKTRLLNAQLVNNQFQKQLSNLDLKPVDDVVSSVHRDPVNQPLFNFARTTSSASAQSTQLQANTTPAEPVQSEQAQRRQQSQRQVFNSMTSNLLSDKGRHVINNENQIQQYLTDLEHNFAPQGKSRVATFGVGAVGRNQLSSVPTYYVPEGLIVSDTDNRGKQINRLTYNLTQDAYLNKIHQANWDHENGKYFWRSAAVAENSPVTVDELTRALGPYFLTGNMQSSFTQMLNDSNNGFSTVVTPNYVQASSNRPIPSAKELNGAQIRAFRFDDRTNPPREIQNALRDAGVNYKETSDVNLLDHNGHKFSPSDVSKVQAILQAATDAGLDYSIQSDTKRGQIYLKANDNRGMRITLLDIDNPTNIGSVRDRSGNQYSVDWSRVNLLTTDGNSRPVFAPLDTNGNPITMSAAGGNSKFTQDVGNTQTFLTDFSSDRTFGSAQNIETMISRYKQRQLPPYVQASIAQNLKKENGEVDNVHDFKNAVDQTVRDDAMRAYQSLPRDFKNYMAVLPMIEALGIDPQRLNSAGRWFDKYGYDPKLTNYRNDTRLSRMISPGSKRQEAIELEKAYNPATGQYQNPIVFGINSNSEMHADTQNSVAMRDSLYNNATTESSDYKLNPQDATKAMLKHYQDARLSLAQSLSSGQTDDTDQTMDSILDEYHQMIDDITEKYNLDLSNEADQKNMAKAYAMIVQTIADGKQEKNQLNENYYANVTQKLDQLNVDDSKKEALTEYAMRTYRLINNQTGTSPLNVIDGFEDLSDEEALAQQVDKNWYQEYGYKDGDNKHIYLDTIQEFTSSTRNAMAYNFELTNQAKQTIPALKQTFSAHRSVQARLIQQRMVEYEPNKALYWNDLTAQMPSKDRYDYQQAFNDRILQAFDDHMRQDGEKVELSKLAQQVHEFSENYGYPEIDETTNEPYAKVWQQYYIDGKLMNPKSRDGEKLSLLQDTRDALESNGVQVDYRDVNSGQTYSRRDLINQRMHALIEQGRSAVQAEAEANAWMDIIDGKRKDANGVKKTHYGIDGINLVPDIGIDENGLIHWRGHQLLNDDGQTAAVNGNQMIAAPVEGELGQFFVPDRRNITKTNYHTFDDVDHESVQDRLVAGYRATVQNPEEINQRGDWNPDALKNVNERMVVTGQFQQVRRELKENIRMQTAKLPSFPKNGIADQLSKMEKKFNRDNSRNLALRNPQNDPSAVGKFLGHDAQHRLYESPADPDVLQAQYDQWFTNDSKLPQEAYIKDFGEKAAKGIGVDGFIDREKFLERRDFSNPEDTTIVNKVYGSEVASTKLAPGQFVTPEENVEDQDTQNRALYMYARRVRLNNAVGEATNTAQVVGDMHNIKDAIEEWQKENPDKKPFEDANFEYEIKNFVHSRVQALGGNNIGKMALPENLGYIDMITTGQGKSQGLVRILADAAQVQEDGHVTPAMVPVPMTAEDQKAYENGTNDFEVMHVTTPDPKDPNKVTTLTYKMSRYLDGNALTKDSMFKYLSNLPFDRAFIAIEQAAKANHIDKHAKLALMNANLMNMEDGSVISKKFAETHPVIGADGNLRPLMAGDKLSDVSGDKTTITMVVDPNMSMEEAERRDIVDIVQFIKKTDVDIIKSPLSQISRRNMGQVKFMVDSHSDLVDVYLPKRFDEEFVDAMGNHYKKGDLKPEFDENGQPKLQPASDEYQKLGLSSQPTLTQFADTRKSAQDLFEMDQNWIKFMNEGGPKAFANGKKFVDIHGNEVSSWPEHPIFEHTYNSKTHTYAIKPAMAYEMDTENPIHTNATIGEMPSYVTDILADNKVNNYGIDPDASTEGRKYSDLVANADAERNATALTQYLTSVNSNALPDLREYLRVAGYELSTDGKVFAGKSDKEIEQLRQEYVSNHTSDNVTREQAVADFNRTYLADYKAAISHPGEQRDHFDMNDLMNRVSATEQNAQKNALATAQVVAYTQKGGQEFAVPLISKIDTNKSELSMWLNMNNKNLNAHRMTFNANDYLQNPQKFMDMAQGLLPIRSDGTTIHALPKLTAEDALNVFVRPSTAQKNKIIGKRDEQAIQLGVDDKGNLTPNTLASFGLIFNRIGLPTNDIKGSTVKITNGLTRKERTPAVSDQNNLNQRLYSGKTKQEAYGLADFQQKFMEMIDGSDGGDFELPDDLTVDLPGHPGSKTISILPASLRKNITSQANGQTTVNDYTQEYSRIGLGLARYQAAMDAIKQSVPAYDERNFESKAEFEQYTKQREEILKAASKEAFTRSGVQDAVDRINSKMIQNVFGKEGDANSIKNSFVRQKIMSNRVKASSTAVQTNGFDLPLDVVEASPDVIKSLGMKIDSKTGFAYVPQDGKPQDKSWDMVHVHRDPVWRSHGSLGFRIKVNPSIAGVRVSPVTVSLMDGDFDGDTIGLIAVADSAAQQELHDQVNVLANVYDQPDPSKLGSSDMNISGELIDLADRANFNMDMLKNMNYRTKLNVLTNSEGNKVQINPSELQFGMLKTADGKINQDAVKQMYEIAQKLYPNDKSLQNVDYSKVNSKKAVKLYFNLGMDIINQQLNANADQQAHNQEKLGWDDPKNAMRDFIDNSTMSIRDDNPRRLEGAGIDCTTKDTAAKSYQKIVDRGAKGGKGSVEQMFGKDYYDNEALYSKPMQEFASRMESISQRLMKDYPNAYQKDKDGNISIDLSKVDNQNLVNNFVETKQKYLDNQKFFNSEFSHVDKQLALLGEVMDATKEKSDLTGQPGGWQKKLVSAFADLGPQGLALANAFGYVMTQATLQVKHDPLLAHRLADLEVDAMGSVYNGKYEQRPQMYTLVGPKIAKLNGELVVPMGNDVVVAAANQKLLEVYAKTHEADQGGCRDKDFSFHKMDPKDLHALRDQLYKFNTKKTDGSELSDIELAEAFDKATRPMLSRWDSKTGEPLPGDNKINRMVTNKQGEVLPSHQMTLQEAYGSLTKMFNDANVDIPRPIKEFIGALTVEDDKGESHYGKLKDIEEVNASTLMKSKTHGFDPIAKQAAENTKAILSGNSNSQSLFENKDNWAVEYKELSNSDWQQICLTDSVDAARTYVDSLSLSNMSETGVTQTKQLKQRLAQNDLQSRDATSMVQNYFKQLSKDDLNVIKEPANYENYKEFATRLIYTNTQARSLFNDKTKTLNKAKVAYYKQFNLKYKNDKNIQKQIEQLPKRTQDLILGDEHKNGSLKNYLANVETSWQNGKHPRALPKSFVNANADLKHAQESGLNIPVGFSTEAFRPMVYQKGGIDAKKIKESQQEFINNQYSHLAVTWNKVMQGAVEHSGLKISGFKKLSEKDKNDPIKQVLVAKNNLNKLTKMAASDNPTVQESFKKLSKQMTIDAKELMDKGSTSNNIKFLASIVQPDKLRRAASTVQVNVTAAQERLINDPTLNHQIHQEQVSTNKDFDQKKFQETCVKQLRNDGIAKGQNLKDVQVIDTKNIKEKIVQQVNKSKENIKQHLQNTAENVQQRVNAKKNVAVWGE